MTLISKTNSQYLTLTAIASGLLLTSSIAIASSFQSFAGINYNNASDLFYTVKDMQFILGTSMFTPDVTFNGTSTVPSPPGTPVFLQNTVVSSGSSQVTTKNIFTSYGRFAKKINDQFLFDVDVTEPFLTNVRYDNTSPARYSGTLFKVNSVDIAPTLAYKFKGSLSDLSLAAGFNVLSLSGALASNYPSLPGFIPPATLLPFGVGPDNQIYNELDGADYGWHGGLTYHAAKGTFLSASYFSGYHNMKITGNSYFTNYMSTPVQSYVNLPATSNLTVTQFLSPDWLVQARVFYSQWDVVKQLVLNGTAGPGTGTFVLPANYHNTWREELRTRYNVTKKFALQGIVGYDEAPNNDVDRTILDPQVNRYFVGIGTEYQVIKGLGVMFNYSHAFSDGNVPFNNTNPTSGVNTLGVVDNPQGDLYELRLTYNV